MKVAKVSFVDSDRIEHAVTLEADSLHHAIGLAIAPFRFNNVEPGFRAVFLVQPREALPEHKVPRQQFEAWLAKEGVSSPAETFQRNTLRELLQRRSVSIPSNEKTYTS